MALPRWWVLTFLAAVVLLGSASGFFWLRRPVRAVSQPPPRPRARCPDADAELKPPKVEPEPALALASAGPKVRLLLDGKALAGDEGTPQRLEPGEHQLRAEADGAEPLQLRLVFLPFAPLMIHATFDAQVGLTAVVLGGPCPSCPAPDQKPALDFTRTEQTDAALLADAAQALRAGDWKRAAGRLRAVTPKSRDHLPFARLAAAAYQLSDQPTLALAALGRVPAAEAGTLSSLVPKWTSLAAAELARSKLTGMRRWNLLTERFSALLEKFAPEAPGPVQVATGRLAELSEGFAKASMGKDLKAQDETVTAAEAALGQFVRALRRSRPDDCEFQARISAAL